MELQPFALNILFGYSTELGFFGIKLFFDIIASKSLEITIMNASENLHAGRMSVLGLFITKLVGKFHKDVTKVLKFISVIFYDFRRKKDLDIIGEAYVYINSFLFTVMTRSFFDLILSLKLKQLSFSNRN